MINPIKIKIKGYPKDVNDFYNKNDLMQKIKIIITDFPIIMSVITDYIITEFYSHGKSKINLLQSDLNPLFNRNEFDFNIKETKLLIKGKSQSNLIFDSSLKTSISLKGKTEEKKSISFYIVPDKCYVIGSKSTLKDWDGNTLASMDNLTLSVLSGQLG